MAGSNIERDLIYGLVAMRAGLVGRDALIAALADWSLDTSMPLEAIFRDRLRLSDAQRAMLAGLVETHLSTHHTDFAASPAEIDTQDVLRDTLAPAATQYITPPWVTPARQPAATAGASRFRIVRTHAKGGLGEVFIAIDEELHREIALKEIQSHRANHPESQRRFRFEAEVTGGLEHPGIVPVYGMGQYPDGRPYYAMRFIHGESLREAIKRYHAIEDPARRGFELRQLLGKIVAVCHAVEYAHSRAILHRDIKPHNIMLGPFGETLVVDWGLAKSIGGDGRGDPNTASARVTPLRPRSGSGTAMTRLGSVIGTPQFMSPEQASGEFERLGPASDIYSLGATLDCLLVGEAPSRRSDATTKVREGQFPTPRQVRRDIPKALEAICLKAMALRPEDRYPSARALADDIERWLADEPVSVYPEPLAAQAGRWARRHKTLVVGTGALLVTALLAMSIGLALIRREQRRTEANFRLARAAVDQMLTELAQVELADVPQMEPVREKMLGKALEFNREFLRERGHDPSIRQEAGRANIRLGDIQEMLGDDSDAERAYRRAIALLGGLVAARPDEPSYRRDLAQAQHKLGVLLKESNRFEESERALLEALRLRTALVAELPGDPAYKEDEKNTVYFLGALRGHLAGKLKEVEAAYEEAIAAQRKLVADNPGRLGYRGDLARYLNNLAGLVAVSDRPGAELLYQEAEAIQRRLADRAPTVASYKWQLGRTLNNLGAVRKESQDYQQAELDFGAAIDRLKELADAFPTVPDYRRELASAYGNRSTAFLGGRKPRDAEADLDEAVRIYEALVKQFPRRPDYRYRMALIRRKLGILLANTGRTAQAETPLRAAEGALSRLVAAYPQVPEYRSELGTTLSNLATVLDSLRRTPEARRCVEEAIRNDTIALESNRRNEYYRHFLLRDYRDLELLLNFLRDWTGLAKAADELPGLLPDEPEACLIAARLLARATALAARDPRQHALELSYAERALRRLRETIRREAAPPERLLRDLRDPAFDPIRRGRDEEFQRLEDTLRARIKPPIG